MEHEKCSTSSEVETAPEIAEESWSLFTKPWEHSDVTFIVEGQKVYANKMILSMSSPVMKAMFESDFREKVAAEIELPGKQLNTFLDLMKAAHPPYQFIEYDFEKLVPLTHEYQMTQITDHCERNLLKLPPSVGRLILADKYGLTKLREVCLEYAKTTSLDTIKQDEMYDQIEPATKVEILDYNIGKPTEQLKIKFKQIQDLVKGFQSKSQPYGGYNCRRCDHCSHYFSVLNRIKETSDSTS